MATPLREWFQSNNWHETWHSTVPIMNEEEYEEQARILAERQAHTKATNDHSGELEHYSSYVREVQP